MLVQPLTATDCRSIPEAIASALREEILDGDLPPHERLRQEHLARRFGTSQAPVREAFRLLSAEGLTVAVTNRGVRVTGLDGREAEEIASLRLTLEPGLAAGAATRSHAVDVAAARDAIAEMDAASSPAGLMRANGRFHDVLYAAAGQPITHDLVAGLRDRYERYLRLMWRTTGHAALSNDEHAEILDLVLTGSAGRVREAMMRHIRTSSDVVLGAVGSLIER